MCQTALRVSVRRMVEFSLRSGDILPISVYMMQEGGRAHRSRQQTASAQAEVSVTWQGYAEGISCTVQGRIDLLWTDSTVPCVEELKLIQASAPLPEEPLKVHRMQAVCYGFMLCAEQSLDEVTVRISYVTSDGIVRISFDETLTKGEAEQEFMSMLTPYAHWEALQHSYRKSRDAAIASLTFPFETYRPGQREMAIQVYTAISRKKRLFATLPTGTGKSAAALFPAVKALGEGKTPQLFCLTARGTAQQPILDVLTRFRAQGLPLRSIVLTAKEKCCPRESVRCHPDYCPRAKGYYGREMQALMTLCEMPSFTIQDVHELCEKMLLCPFEFSLAVCELADVVICDYNYVFDPLVMLQRIFGQGHPATLLVDEAHEVSERVRDSLSSRLDSRILRAQRRENGKIYGRSSPYYKALSALLQALEAISSEDASALEIMAGPIDQVLNAAGLEHIDSGEFLRDMFRFRSALLRTIENPSDYRILLQAGKRERSLDLLCLNISSHLKSVTEKLSGCVYYSATLDPLPAMRELLGGDETDALFALPSPFPPENLLLMQYSVDTRYQQRDDSADLVAEAIWALYKTQSGKYAVYFPSYAYLSLISKRLVAQHPDLELNIQARDMDDSARQTFLSRMQQESSPLMSLCVLGGVFSEGIDLPGTQLIGAVIVGVGLPQVNERQETLREHYQQTFGDGFAFAYRYPGMHKVLQAAGRVIRSETDTGTVLFLDTRYTENAYSRLLPPHYRPKRVKSTQEITALGQEFWQHHRILRG